MSGAIFLTGASGFVGRRLVREAVSGGRSVFALVRPSSRIPAEVEGEEITVLRGDVCRPGLGLAAHDLEALQARVTDVIHAAAVREPRDDSAARSVNVDGTSHAIDLALRLPRLRRFVHVSSISVAGTYPGRFYEDWLDVGQSFPNAYSKSKHEAEARVRAAQDLPSVIVRPGSIVGDSTTGESDPSASTFDKLIHAAWRIRRLPRFVPMPRPFPPKQLFPAVPIDHVARATLALALAPAPRATTYCLIDPAPPRLEAVMTHLCDRLGAPRFRLSVPLGPARAIASAPGVAGMLERVRFPVSSLAYLDCTLDFDDHNARNALAPADVRCPPFFGYVDALIDAFLERAGVA
ncbi:MAG: SDR family oxidoreductase [Deltaproteobacteria bacterium]|nr:SDR family oxidoreductase [Deltaproteobacteria bacterium]